MQQPQQTEIWRVYTADLKMKGKTRGKEDSSINWKRQGNQFSP